MQPDAVLASCRLLLRVCHLGTAASPTPCAAVSCGTSLSAEWARDFQEWKLPVIAKETDAELPNSSPTGMSADLG